MQADHQQIQGLQIIIAGFCVTSASPNEACDVTHVAVVCDGVTATTCSCDQVNYPEVCAGEIIYEAVGAV